MNQQFAITPSPGLARRILRIAEDPVLMLTVDAATRELAQEGLLTPQNCSFLTSLSEREQQALQGLLDCDLRAVLPATDPIRGRVVALLAAKACDLPVTVYTERWHDWVHPIKLAKLRAGRKIDEECEVLVPDVSLIDDSDIVKKRRHGLLIMDINVSLYGAAALPYNGLASEYARTIVVATFDGNPFQTKHTRSLGLETTLSLGTILFPTLPQFTGQLVEELNPLKKKRQQIALSTYMDMVNVVPHLVV